jgi:hypothetical protein
MKGKPRRAWLKGIKAWRLRTKESPCVYETEYLNAAYKWAGDVDNTMYKDIRRIFRVPFEWYQDIVEAAYDSSRFRDDKPGRKNKNRGAPPTPLTLKILAPLGVTALGCVSNSIPLPSAYVQGSYLSSYYLALCY